MALSSWATMKVVMSSSMICRRLGLSTLNLERIVNPTTSDDQDDEGAENQVIRDVKAERRQQRVDGLDQWRGVFEGFHNRRL